MSRCLILSDIDGTIMPYGEPTVSERTHQAYLSALEAGHVVGLATGRAYAQIPPFFNGDTRCVASGVVTNGLCIYHEGELLKGWHISADEIDEICAAIEGVPHTGFLYFEGDTQPLLYSGDKEDLAIHMKRYADMCIASPNLHKGGVKVNVFTNQGVEGATELAQMLMDKLPTLDFDVPQAGFLNVMPKGVNKGSSVLWFANYLGIAPEDIYVFGDADNDITMLKAIKNSAAVAGATQGAKDAARWHIGECADDAVAQVIEKIVAGQFPYSD